MRADLTACRGRRVCVALSGGGDSVALFFYLKDCAAEQGITLSALNVEHGMRAASVRDTAFVQALCAREGVPLFCFRADIPARAAKNGRGMEEEARLFRRACYAQVLREGKADVVVTAHHAGDNAESVLFNLFRGCSLTGAGGIRAFVPLMGEKGVARPFLGVSKAEISAYLQERSLAFCEDETNADERFTRNFLRRRVLAPAKERFARAEEHLYAFSRTAREDDDFLNALAAERLRREGGAVFWAADLPDPLFRRCGALALRELGAERELTGAHIEALLGLRAAQSGARVCLPAPLCAVREYEWVRLFRANGEQVEQGAFSERAFCEGTFVFPRGTLTVERRQGAEEPLCGEGEGARRALVLDAEALPAGCVLRTLQTGDVFCRFGGGTKSLKKALSDKKIPARVRAALPVVAKENNIFAVCGVEIAESVKMTRHTRAVYILRYEEGTDERV